MSIHHPQLQHPKGMLTSRDIFLHCGKRGYCQSCTKCPSTVYIGETGRRFAERSREHRRDIINGKNDLSVPFHFNQTNHTLEDMKAAVLKAGLTNQEYRKRSKRWGWFSNMGLWVLVALTKTLVSRESLFFCLLARRGALFHVARARVYNQARELI